MKRPNLEQDYIFDSSKGDYLHHETKNTYDADIEAYVDYLESVVKNCSIPAVVGRSEQCEHRYGFLVKDGGGLMQCSDCGDTF